jgi:osmoprotectant transport system permease protein
VRLFEFYARHAGEVWLLLGQHVGLVAISTAIASALGLPLGVLVARRPAWRRPVLGLANVFQTIPSLALFGLLIPVFGIGAWTAITALVVYALLPIVRNTYAGIAGVDPAVREAGRGMGMTDGELLRLVELPLAAGVILAGVRIATVVSVGIATIAAAIGAGGLGVYIFRGVATVDNTLILAGAIPAALLALLADALLGFVERRLVWRQR